MHPSSTSPIRRACSALCASLALLATNAGAQDVQISDDVVRLGILTDLNGPFADITGPGSAAAIQMAIDDFGGQVLGKKIELIVADHQNKADIASSKAREWFDTGKVDAIMDVAVSAPALAALEIAKQKQKVIIFNGPGLDRLTNDLCMPSTGQAGFPACIDTEDMFHKWFSRLQERRLLPTADEARTRQGLFT